MEAAPSPTSGPYLGNGGKLEKAQLRNRLIAFMNWVYNYFTYDRNARMIGDIIPPNREAGPAVRRHYQRLQVMETTGPSYEFIDGEKS